MWNCQQNSMQRYQQKQEQLEELKKTINVPQEVQQLKGFAVITYQQDRYVVLFDDKFIFIGTHDIGGKYQAISMADVKKVLLIHMNYILIVKQTQQIGIFQVRIHSPQNIQLVRIKDFLKAESYFLRQVKQQLYQVQVFFSRNQFCSYQFSKTGQIGFLSYTIDNKCNIVKTKDMALYGTRQFYSERQAVLIRILNQKTVTKIDLKLVKNRKNYVIGSSNHKKFFLLSIDTNGIIYIQQIEQKKSQMMFPIKIDRAQLDIYYNTFMIRSSEKTLVINIQSIKKISLVAVLQGISDINAWVSKYCLANYCLNNLKQRTIKLISTENSRVSGKIKLVQSRVLEIQNQEIQKNRIKETEKVKAQQVKDKKEQKPVWKPAKIITRNKVNTSINKNTQNLKKEETEKQENQNNVQSKNQDMQTICYEKKENTQVNNFLKNEQSVAGKNNKESSADNYAKQLLQSDEINKIQQTKVFQIREYVEQIVNQHIDQQVQQGKQPKPIFAAWSINQKQKQLEQLQKITEGNHQKMKQIQKQIEALLTSKSNTMTELEKAFQQQQIILEKLKSQSGHFLIEMPQNKIFFGEDCRLPPKIKHQVQYQNVKQQQKDELYQEKQYMQMVEQFYDQIIDKGTQDSKFIDQIIEQLMIQGFQNEQYQHLNCQNYLGIQQNESSSRKIKNKHNKTNTQINFKQDLPCKVFQVKMIDQENQQALIKQKKIRDKKQKFSKQLDEFHEAEKDLVKCLNSKVQKIQNIRKQEIQVEKNRNQFSKNQIIGRSIDEVNKVLIQQVLNQVEGQSKRVFSLQQTFYKNVTKELQFNSQKHSKIIEIMSNSNQRLISQYISINQKMGKEVDQEFWKLDCQLKNQISANFQDCLNLSKLSHRQFPFFSKLERFQTS